MLETLDARLAQARAGELGHLDFLQVLCDDEITRREPSPSPAASAAPASRAGHPGSLRLRRSPEAAGRPDPRPGRTALAAAGESVILYGPVGVGKSHVAQALGHLAIRRGADVRFTKTSRALPTWPADTPTAAGTNASANSSAPPS